MKILLEGPDCTGKTTLGNVLKQIFPGEYIHNQYISDSELDSCTMERVYSMINQTTDNENIIIDRDIISEYIYGNVYRGNARCEIEDIEDLVNMYDLIIFCLPHDRGAYLDYFKKSVESRNEYITDKTIIEKIYNEYNFIYLKLKEELATSSENRCKIARYDFLQFLNNF